MRSRAQSLLWGILVALLVIVAPILVIAAQNNNGLAQPAAKVSPSPLASATNNVILDYGTLSATDPFVIQVVEDTIPQLTETACALNLCAPTPTPPNIDAVYITATYIVGRATEGAAAQLTGTACALFTCSSTPQLSATYGPSPTPTPTVDTAALRERYLNTLISEVGFKVPLFDRLANNFLRHAAEMGNYDLQFDPQVAVTWFAGSKYVAVIIPVAEDLFAQDVFLVFQITDGNPVLVPDLLPSIDDNLILSFDSGRRYQWDDEKGLDGLNGTQAVIGFADRNNNGLPDLVVMDGAGGSCCDASLNLLEIQSDGSIVDITPVTKDVYPAYFTDSNYDGSWEIIGISARVGANDPILIRWFGWDGKAYVDISAQHTDFYMPVINTFLDQLNTEKQACYPLGFDHLPDLEAPLFNYYAMGRLREGVETIFPLLRWDKCSPPELWEYGHNLAYILRWLP